VTGVQTCALPILPVSLGLVALGPLLTEFRSRYPEVRLDLVLSNDLLDLIGEEIDVALRFGSLPDSTLVARNLGSYRPYIYASPRSEEHTSDSSHVKTSYAVFCLKKKNS